MSTCAPINTLNIESQLSLSLFIHDVCDISDQSKSLNLSDELSIDTCSGLSFMRDDSMAELGIYESDLLIVDRQLKPQHDDIVLYRLEGELACRKLDMKSGVLHCGGQLEAIQHQAIHLKDHVGLVIEGVVRHIIHSLR